VRAELMDSRGVSLKCGGGISLQANFIAHFLQLCLKQARGPSQTWFYVWKWKSESVRLLVLDNWKVLHCPYHGHPRNMVLKDDKFSFPYSNKVSINLAPK